MSGLEMQSEPSLGIIIFGGIIFVVFSLFFLAVGVFCVALRDRYKHSPVQEYFKEYYI